MDFEKYTTKKEIENMKKSNLKVVKWIIAKMESAESQLEYNRDAWKREQERAQADEREPEKYYLNQVRESEKEKEILMAVFELI